MNSEMESAAARILRERYGIGGQIDALPGEHDSNFHVLSTDGVEFLFKIHAAHWTLAEVECQAAALEHLGRADRQIGVSRLVRDRAGRALSPIELEGAARWCRLTTWMAGTLWAEAGNLGASSRRSLGEFLGRLDHALASFAHAGAERAYGWDLAQAERHLPGVDLIADPERREAAGQVLRRFAEIVKPRLGDCPVQIIHNDANDRNILLDPEGRVVALLDFGDMVRSHRVSELAVAAAYGAIGAADPVQSTCEIVAGYCDENRLLECEGDLLLDLIETRYAVSMVMAARQSREQPDNAYLLVSQDAVWKELRRLRAGRDRFASLRLRSSAGWEPVPNARRILRWLEQEACPPPIMTLPQEFEDFAVLEFDRAAILALAQGGGERDRVYAAWVSRELERSRGRVAVAPHGEDRALDPQTGGSDIHLGIDVFAPEGTEILAPFAATIEQAGIDRAPFGFGGSLLLRHETGDGTPFWIFLGHLDPKSIASWRRGEAIEAGAPVGRLGDSAANGGWPSHLQLQLWTELLHDEIAAMPGLCQRRDWEIWQSLCPDPNLVLGLPVNASRVVAREGDWLEAQRRRHVGRVFSLAYKSPLKIVGGSGCHLFDEGGNAYLDLVNNVCHVGHCHPRVVAAGQAQMARLNTNTRYLHDMMVEYARRLTQTLPPELSVCFFVNSGSEANDLALRIARAHTRRRDIIVLDHAYHGHLSSLIEISPYKFAGPGGEGRAEHVQVAEMPDLYRGRFRYGDGEAGTRYAASIGEIIAALGRSSRAPAAFICESILGTGGQLVLPDGYLRAAYAIIREAGAVAIADEVQIGFGRAGHHMWAFETQSVVPDIVTMGKPIGNGHPIAAVVVRPEIAASFVTGMEYFNTFGGNPVAAAIGLSVLDVIRDERLMQNASATGEILRRGLLNLAREFPVIGDVRNLGLFFGVEFVADRETRAPAAETLARVIETLKERHILTASEGPHRNVLKIKPPMVIGAPDCAFFLGELKSCLAAL